MKKKIIVDHGTYPFDIVVFVGWSDKQVIKELYKYTKLSEQEIHGLGTAGEFDARTVMLDGGQTVLRFNEWEYDAKHIALLVHETLHMVQFLFERIVIENDSSSWEAWAYQQQYLFENILEELNKLK